MLSWQYALSIAGGLAVVALAARALWGRRIGVVAEAALLFGLYGLWQFAASFTVMSQAGAMGRARWLWHAERGGPLPTEAGGQRGFPPHPAPGGAFRLVYR